MNHSISNYLLKQTCASIACIDNEGFPYSFCCFYVFNPDNGCLYFKSSTVSMHASFIEAKPQVSGTVLPDKLNKLSIIGVQFEGICLSEEDQNAHGASQFYHKKNPMALAMPGKVWVIQMNHIKLTDSSLVFGKKMHWNREATLAG